MIPATGTLMEVFYLALLLKIFPGTGSVRSAEQQRIILNLWTEREENEPNHMLSLKLDV